MKLTIRTKMFLLLSGFIVLLVVIGLVCNLLLLRQFYVARNRVLLRTLGNEVVAAIQQGQRLRGGQNRLVGQFKLDPQG